MRGLGVLAVYVVLAVVVGITVWWVLRSGRRAEARARRARATTPWVHYSRPNLSDGSGRWEVGIERVADGMVLDDVPMVQLRPGHSGDERLDAEGEAIVRAQLYNDTKVGMT